MKCGTLYSGPQNSVFSGDLTELCIAEGLFLRSHLTIHIRSCSRSVRDINASLCMPQQGCIPEASFCILGSTSEWSNDAIVIHCSHLQTLMSELEMLNRKQSDPTEDDSSKLHTSTIRSLEEQVTARKVYPLTICVSNSRLSGTQHRIMSDMLVSKIWDSQACGDAFPIALSEFQGSEFEYSDWSLVMMLMRWPCSSHLLNYSDSITARHCHWVHLKSIALFLEQVLKVEKSSVARDQGLDMPESSSHNADTLGETLGILFQVEDFPFKTFLAVTRWIGLRLKGNMINLLCFVPCGQFPKCLHLALNQVPGNM